MTQGDLFHRLPEIPAATNLSGRNVWFDQSSLFWTLEPQPRLTVE